MKPTLTIEDRRSLLNFHQALKKVLASERRFDEIKLSFLGLNLFNNSGRKNISSTVIFTENSDSKNGDLIINLQDTNLINEQKIKLVKLILKSQKIHFKFEKFYNFNKKNKQNLKSYIDQLHPEALMLFDLCVGKGLDIGCGFRKTHPDAIGVDWIAKGFVGKVGNVKGEVSAADIKARGDKLTMFASNSIDYIVARHNLEHYHHPEKTLKEWVRVLKKGGKIGIIVPDSENPQTFEKTHYFNFTLENFAQIIKENGQIKIKVLADCIPGWSFYCIGEKI